VMTGRVTMLGIARWSGKGGSYRTVQRLYATVMPWRMLFWVFFREHLWRTGESYLLAGDEVVVSKAGKHTHGLDRFFSSVYGKAIPGMSFFALSLVSIQERHAYPLSVEQVVRNAAEKEASQAKRAVKQSKQSKQSKQKRAEKGQQQRGRPKGSKNKNKAAVSLPPELIRIGTLVQDLLQRISGVLAVRYLLLDGHFGNNNALVMVRTSGLHLVSKLRCDAKLYLPYVGPYSGRGPHRKYGSRLNYQALPVEQCKATTVDAGIQTAIYQLTLLHKEFCQALNVVIIVKTNQATGARAHVCLFSSDLDLAYDHLIDYYRLRFQIEFNFRDAKQFWGLEDFMNIKQTAVTNAANLSLFMVNVAHCLLRNLHHSAGLDSSVLDLKAFCRGLTYAEETLKLLPQSPEPVLFAQILHKVAYLGRIHQAKTHTASP
jgi:putative transposase